MTEPLHAARPEDTAYPPAPWPMVGSLWVTLFKVARDVDELRPAGIYGAAFVSYEEGSPLTYRELLVARPVADPAGGRGRRVSITDIWVDSPASVAGGRELWAIPKGLADFDLDRSWAGPLGRAAWSASIERRPVAEARFTDVSRLAPRVPFTGHTWQPGIDDTGGEERRATMKGTARTLPCRASWHFAAEGPLAFLRGARQLGSARMHAFRMSFG